MFDWTKESIDDFLDEYKHWDGHQTATAIALHSVDLGHLEWLQTLGRLRGIGGQIKHSVTRSNFGGTKHYVTDYYNLGQNARQFATARSIKKTEYSNKSTRVYCPTVESSFFYVRRNGKIFVTGNSNYYGTPFTMARSLKIPQAVAEEFQARYVRGGTFKDVDGMQHTVEPAFPGIARWWQWTAHRLQTVHNITTPFGRTRHFFGRPDDDTTLREAIAYLPQSTTADRMNLALYRVWRYMPHIQLLAQTYDSISFQYREDDPRGEDAIVSEALKHVEVELTAQNGRKYVVPGEAKVGWNWGYYTGREDVDRARKAGKIIPRLNFDGLLKWSSKKKDERKRQTALERFGSMQIR